jgi:hypothetical protein
MEGGSLIEISIINCIVNRRTTVLISWGLSVTFYGYKTWSLTLKEEDSVRTLITAYLREYPDLRWWNNKRT